MTFSDETIEVVDKNGIVRIRLGIDNRGSPSLSLNDADGRERLILTVDDEGNGSLGFRTSKGQPTVSLGVSSDLGSGMMVLDVQKELRLTLGIVGDRCQIQLDTREGAHFWPAPDAKPQPREEPDDTASAME